MGNGASFDEQPFRYMNNEMREAVPQISVQLHTNMRQTPLSRIRVGYCVLFSGTQLSNSAKSHKIC
jgi:hypothetical protein